METPTGRSLHRKLALRLVAVWIVMSVLLGFGAVEFGHWKIDDYVFGLASTGADLFNAHWLALPLAANKAEHESEVRTLLKRLPFVGVRVTGEHGMELLNVSKPGSEALVGQLRAGFALLPQKTTARHEKLWTDGQLFVQVRVPLVAPQGRVAGHLEGIYQVDPTVVEAIKDRVRQSMLLVVLVVGATSAVLYPIVVSLNRATLRLARQLLDSNLDLMRTLGSAIAKRDSDTDAHNYRVTLYAIALGEAIGLSAREMRALVAGSFLHDAGKIGIPDRILLKPGPLTPEELHLIRRHVTIGCDIICHSEWLAQARDVVLHHHEWFDGTGYPSGLRGEAIPLLARVFAVVDVFDALMSKRPYKKPFPVEQALEVLRQQRGRHFDPAPAGAFAQLAPELHECFGKADEETLHRALAAKLHGIFDTEAVPAAIPVGSSERGLRCGAPGTTKANRW